LSKFRVSQRFDDACCSSEESLFICRRGNEVQIWDRLSQSLICEFVGSVSLNLQYYVRIDRSEPAALAILRLGRIYRRGLTDIARTYIFDNIICLAVSNLGDIVASYVVPNGRTTLRVYSYQASSNSLHDAARVGNWKEYQAFRGLASPTQIEIDGDFIHAVCSVLVATRSCYVIWDWKKGIVSKCDLNPNFVSDRCVTDWGRIDTLFRQVLVKDEKLVTVFDIWSSKIVTKILANSGVQQAAFSVPDGKSIITCHRYTTDQGVIKISSMPRGTLLATLKPKLDDINETWDSVYLNSSGKCLLSVTSTGEYSTFRFWRLDTGGI